LSAVSRSSTNDLALRHLALLRLTVWVTDELSWNSSDFLNARGEAQENLHARAASAAHQKFGRKVFIRGVVEVSNFCRENCQYCGMRRDNKSLSRFRGRHDQLAELLIHHRPSSITDINIQTGEDPVAVREVVVPLIRTLRRETNLGVSVCVGTLNAALYDELKAAGATIYIIKFEMADADAYAQMQAPGRWEERVEHIQLLAKKGWHVSSGFIAGLPGQTSRALLANFHLARQLPLAGCSVSPFIPGESTPLAAAPTADIDLTLNCMAMLRLMRSGWVIPAVSALNMAEPGTGYRRGLRTGANLVTINLTPSAVRDDYLLYKRERFIMTEERILAAIQAEGLFPSELSLAGYYEGKLATSPQPVVAGLI
jgi:biotin synthase